jgi:hypothetical protein
MKVDYHLRSPLSEYVIQGIVHHLLSHAHLGVGHVKLLHCVRHLGEDSLSKMVIWYFLNTRKPRKKYRSTLIPNHLYLIRIRIQLDNLQQILVPNLRLLCY